MGVMLGLTHTHTHVRSCSSGAWGPIYLHAVEEEQTTARKKEGAWNSGENPEEGTNFSTVPKDRHDQFTI